MSNKLLDFVVKLFNVPKDVVKSVKDGSASRYSHETLGTISRKFESGKSGPGTISSGRGDPGGKSYGCHQLASKTGTLYEYLRRSRYHDRFLSVMPKKFAEPSGAFDRIWRQIAKEEPEMFTEDQFKFIKKRHFDSLRGYATGLGIPSTRAIDEALFSIGVQHGRSKKVVQQANIVKGNTETTIINKLYDSREAYVKRIKLPAGTKRSVLNRYKKERKMVLALVK